MTDTTEFQINTKQAQMKKGVLEFAILLIIAQKEVYASDILKELKRANLIVVEGTLYPLMSRLKNAGWIGYSWVESEAGPPRKYYTLTRTGQTILEQLRQTWHSLSDSIEQLENNHKTNLSA